MPLENLVCGLLETGVNKLHQLDSSAKQKRKLLDGTVIGIQFKEIKRPFYFIISHQQVDILSHFKGQTDCFIRLSLITLLELQDSNQLTTLIKSGQLEVDGDIKLVQKFALLLTEMEIDWEEQLSYKVGDLIAHKLVYHAHQCKKQLSKHHKTTTRQLAEIITEELKLAPGPLEVAYFCEQVNDIEQQVADLEKRLNCY